MDTTDVALHNKNGEITEDSLIYQIKDASDSVSNIRPAYSDVLDFYKEIFIAQEESKKKIKIEPPFISKETLNMKMKEGFPLISVYDFPIDQNASLGLMNKICDLVGRIDPERKFFPDTFLHANRNKKKIMLSAIMKNDDELLEKTAKEFNVDKMQLSFILYNSLIPSIDIGVHKLAKHFTKDFKWERGYCPICGSGPIFSLTGHDDQRFLYCIFCRYEWRFKKLCCPFCGNEDIDAMGYLYNAQEEQYRADICKKCGRYLKSIDISKMKHFIYIPLEMISTLHLDAKAREMGFTGAAAFSTLI